MNSKAFFLLIAFTYIYGTAASQTDKLSGKVLNGETNSPLPGATVLLKVGDQEKKGVSTDAEGRFFFSIQKGQIYYLKVSSIGFTTRTLENITAGNASLEIVLLPGGNSLQQVVVKTNVRKASVASLYSVQKNSSAISDGISADVIRKSPDKNAGDVLKRVSGASIQDNKFVVIRGLSERYNVSLLNNSVLPSTEGDKKAFAFDIIPSSVIDNLVIYKSPTPDLPGDFSGGAIKVITKDYPSRKIRELAVSIGYNSQTTGKNFYSGFPKGSYDAIGFFDNSRLIPGPYYRNRAGFINNSPEFKREVTKLFPNTFGFEPASKSLPSVNVSYTGGNTALLKNGNKLGYVYSIGYSNGKTVYDKNRSDYDINKTPLYDYNTVNYEEKNNLTALLNLTWSYGKSKISLKNLFNNSFVKSVAMRSGANYAIDVDRPFYIKSVNSEATGNGLANSVVEGLHRLTGNWTVDWNASFAYTYKNQPDQRILTFRSPEKVNGDYYLKLNYENSPEIRNAGRVYSFLGENIYGASANAAKDFKWWGHAQKLKFGTMNYYRDRSVDVEAMGYATLKGDGVTINETKTSGFNNLFSSGNIDTYDLTVSNIETNSTNYTGNALMTAGYLMLDNKFTDKIKLTWGARVEKYRQELAAKNKGTKVYDNTDILPSLLLTYSLNNTTNIRLAGSKAVNRPEFRELAAYGTYDYDNYLAVIGNPDLQRCKNTNADLRYEWFPAAGEIISASLFYKYFDKPIEQTNQGNDVLSYKNADHATAYGVELELRKKLDFIRGGFFEQLTFYTNAAYIKGSVQFETLKYNSPLQGQSPYLINGGLNYVAPDEDFSFNILYNRIGPRLRYRAASGAALNIFERPRDLVDLQVSKKFIGNRLEAKMTVSDLFAQPFSWYYKYAENPSNINYKAGEDKLINSSKYGTTITLSIRYSFGQ